MTAAIRNSMWRDLPKTNLADPVLIWWLRYPSGHWRPVARIVLVSASGPASTWNSAQPGEDAPAHRRRGARLFFRRSLLSIGACEYLGFTHRVVIGVSPRVSTATR